MKTAEELQDNIGRQVDDIAYEQEEFFEEGGCGCGGGCGCHSHETDMEYFDQEYHPYAAYGISFGVPTRYAGIKEGETVVDLGNGAGMARLGDNDQLPLNEKTAHVVIGNGIMNMVPDKEKAFSEIYRILKNHGRVALSEIVVKGDMPKGLRLDAEMYVGCMAGSLSMDQYVQILTESGFEEITFHEERKLELPDAMLHYYLPPEEAQQYREGAQGIYSVTLTAEKPCCHAGEEDHVCCGNH
jgi:arsenite methyltransferase